MEPSRKNILSPSSNQQALSSTPQTRPSPSEKQTSQKQSTTQRDQASRSQQRQQQLRLQFELQQKQQQLQQQKQQQQLQQQKQQQQQQKRDQSPDVLTVHVRTQQPPLTKPKPRYYEEIKNTSSSHEKQKERQKTGKSDNNKHRQSKGGNTTDQDKNIRGVNVNSRNSKQHLNLVPSHHNLSSDRGGSHVVTSQPRPPRSKRTSAVPCGKDNTTNTSSSISKRKESKNPNKSKVKQKEKQNMTGSLTQTMKPSRNSVGALEAGIPDRFCDTPDNKETISTSTRVAAAAAGSTTTEPDDKKSTKKLLNHDLTDIPQTNLSVGLIVFCCFNPLFGAMSIYLSLSAAKAYRDGRESKGNSRAHWSILVSLFGITVTMVIVSSIVVVFSMGKHSNSDYRQATSQALGF